MKIIYLILLFKIILVSKVSAETGCIKGDCRGGFGNGKSAIGTYVYDNGDTYVGEWKYGERYGKGVYTYNNGDTYNGEFVMNKKDGNGVYTSADGTKTEGIWSDNEIFIVCISGNCKNGKGVIKKIRLLSDKDKTYIYRGDLLNYAAHGRGSLIFSDGERYVGEVKFNRFHGEGTLTSASGETFQGNFFEGWRDGEGITIFPDGKTEKEYYKRGRRIYVAKSKKDLQDHINKHRIKEDIKLKCMLTKTDSYDYEPRKYNIFYLTLDKTNNQIIASGFNDLFNAYNITYDEINYNSDEKIVANTIKNWRNKTHFRLELDKYTGDLKVLNDIDYNNEGIEKSLDAKIRGGVSNGYVWSGFGHAAECKEKIF